jgi:hypothetical protein
MTRSHKPPNLVFSTSTVVLSRLGGRARNNVLLGMRGIAPRRSLSRCFQRIIPTTNKTPLSHVGL